MLIINKIYKRLTLVQVKQRLLPLFCAMQNIILALIVLIYANVIISNGKVTGELNYTQVKFFYNLVIILLFITVSIFTPYFLAFSLNSMVKNYSIEYMLSANIKLKDIIYATFLRGWFSSAILLVSALPIASISFYFGGMGIVRIARLIVCLIMFGFLIAGNSLFVSTLFKDIASSTVVSYVLSVILLVIHIFVFKYIINSYLSIICYVILVFFILLLLLRLARKGRIFNY